MKKTLLPLTLSLGLVTSIFAQYNHDFCPCQDDESPFDVSNVLQQTSTQNTTPIIPGYLGFTASSEPTVSTQNIFVVEEKPERINLSITLEEMLSQMEVVEENEEEETPDQQLQQWILEQAEANISEDDYDEKEEEILEEGENKNSILVAKKKTKSRSFVRVKNPKRAKKYAGKCPKFW